MGLCLINTHRWAQMKLFFWKKLDMYLRPNSFCTVKKWDTEATYPGVQDRGNCRQCFKNLTYVKSAFPPASTPWVSSKEHMTSVNGQVTHWVMFWLSVYNRGNGCWQGSTLGDLSHLLRSATDSAGDSSVYYLSMNHHCSSNSVQNSVQHSW